jgi:3'-5' exoribonuclease
LQLAAHNNKGSQGKKNVNFDVIDPRTGAQEGFALLKSVTRKTGKNGADYLDIILADIDSELPAKLWSYNPELHGEYSTNQIVKVRGTQETYRDQPQFRIERIRLAGQDDGIDFTQFIAVATDEPEAMYGALISIAEGFEDAGLKSLVLELYAQRKEQLLVFPAAFRLHHAVRSGLLWHTLSVVRLCQGAVELYPFLCRDLLLCGAMLHDICKLEEYAIADTGLASGYTAEGTLIGHLVKGAMLVEREGERLGVPPKTRMLLAHMLISHHGQPEFGAASRPLFLEAEVLSQCDLLDATVFEFHEAQKSAMPGEFSQRKWSLHDRKIFNHGGTGEFRPHILEGSE